MQKLDHILSTIVVIALAVVPAYFAITGSGAVRAIAVLFGVWCGWTGFVQVTYYGIKHREWPSIRFNPSASWAGKEYSARAPHRHRRPR